MPVSIFLTPLIISLLKKVDIPYVFVVLSIYNSSQEQLFLLYLSSKRVLQCLPFKGVCWLFTSLLASFRSVVSLLAFYNYKALSEQIARTSRPVEVWHNLESLGRFAKQYLPAQEQNDR
mmetsp:Transcript_1285/g.2563  ORF Transcript_1285/g.2563 Transcript_1285/m.2563 type:complete len:119 (+) Transcript_1285:2041-2397(+)